MSASKPKRKYRHKNIDHYLEDPLIKEDIRVANQVLDLGALFEDVIPRLGDNLQSHGVPKRLIGTVAAEGLRNRFPSGSKCRSIQINMPDVYKNSEDSKNGRMGGIAAAIARRKAGKSGANSQEKPSLAGGINLSGNSTAFSVSESTFNLSHDSFVAKDNANLNEPIRIAGCWHIDICSDYKGINGHNLLDEVAFHSALGRDYQIRKFRDPISAYGPDIDDAQLAAMTVTNREGDSIDPLVQDNFELIGRTSKSGFGRNHYPVSKCYCGQLRQSEVGCYHLG